MEDNNQTIEVTETETTFMARAWRKMKKAAPYIGIGAVAAVAYIVGKTVERNSWEQPELHDDVELIENEDGSFSITSRDEDGTLSIEENND